MKRKLLEQLEYVHATEENFSSFVFQLGEHALQLALEFGVKLSYNQSIQSPQERGICLLQMVAEKRNPTVEEFFNTVKTLPECVASANRVIEIWEKQPETKRSKPLTSFWQEIFSLSEQGMEIFEKAKDLSQTNHLSGQRGLSGGAPREKTPTPFDL